MVTAPHDTPSDLSQVQGGSTPPLIVAVHAAVEAADAGRAAALAAAAAAHERDAGALQTAAGSVREGTSQLAGGRQQHAAGNGISRPVCGLEGVLLRGPGRNRAFQRHKITPWYHEAGLVLAMVCAWTQLPMLRAAAWHAQGLARARGRRWARSAAASTRSPGSSTCATRKQVRCPETLKP